MAPRKSPPEDKGYDTIPSEVQYNGIDVDVENPALDELSPAMQAVVLGVKNEEAELDLDLE